MTRLGKPDWVVERGSGPPCIVPYDRWVEINHGELPPAAACRWKGGRDNYPSFHGSLGEDDLLTSWTCDSDQTYAWVLDSARGPQRITMDELASRQRQEREAARREYERARETYKRLHPIFREAAERG